MKKHDEIEERAKYLVSCFSDKDGKGSPEHLPGEEV